MDQDYTTTLTRLRWPLFFIAAGLILIPLLDFAVSILPLDFGNLRWRWSTLGLLTGFLFTPLFAIILVCFLAAMLEDRMAQRVVSVLNLATAVILVVFLIAYALDVVQLRADLPEEDRLPFYMSAVRAGAKFLFFILAWLWLGIAGLRASKAPRTTRARRETAPLVTGGGI